MVLAAAELLEDLSSTSVVASGRGQPSCWNTLVPASLLLEMFVEASVSPEPKCWKAVASHILVHATMLRVLQLLLPALITELRTGDLYEGSVTAADEALR